MDKTTINLARIRAYDWEESEHPRAANGQFTSGAGSDTNISVESLNNAPYSSSIMNDNYATVKIDGVEYKKVKKDRWQSQTTQGHTIGETLNNQELLKKIKGAKQVSTEGFSSKTEAVKEVNGKSNGSPLRQAAEVLQGGDKKIFSDLSRELAELGKDKSTDKQTREAISALGSNIKSALQQAHSEKGFTGGMLQDGKADKLAKKLSEITGEKYYIDTNTEKGFMGMNFTKKVLKVKE